MFDISAVTICTLYFEKFTTQVVISIIIMQCLYLLPGPVMCYLEFIDTPIPCLNQPQLVPFCYVQNIEAKNTSRYLHLMCVSARSFPCSVLNNGVVSQGNS